MTDEEILHAILTKPTVPLWPVTGRALSLGRSATYAAAAKGGIPVLDVGARQKPVPTAWLRKKLGLGGGEPGRP